MDWYLVRINPEPWTVGQAQVGRRQGKLTASITSDRQLREYQAAIREDLQDRVKKFYRGNIRLQFFFWRQSASYRSVERSAHRNRPDVTNMQKAVEDALQGVLFANDRAVVDVHSVLIQHGPETEGKILIAIEEDTIPPSAMIEIPQDALKLLAESVMETQREKMIWGGEHDRDIF